MFALELDFHDGVSPPETILVRRPHAIIGTSEYAHVLIEGGDVGLTEVRITRGLGREFLCRSVPKAGQELGNQPFLEGVYSREAEINLGDVSAHITALDSDLSVSSEESPDRAGVRVLRAAMKSGSPVFPAVAVLGSNPLFSSFPPELSLIVGRSRKCGLRLDSSDVSSEHARIGFEDNSFWVEDLGSTNGTFVDGQRISGRRFLKKNEMVSLGLDFTLATVSSAEDVKELNLQFGEKANTIVSEKYFPCIVSKSQLVRPSRFIIGANSRVSIGRDPANDIWVGAPHISRKHAEVLVNQDGKLEVKDLSTNGIFLDDEPLPVGEAKLIPEQICTLDLCSGIELKICYNRDEEASLVDLSNLKSEEQISSGELKQAEKKVVQEQNKINQAKSESSENEEKSSVFRELASRHGNPAAYLEEVASEYKGASSADSGEHLFQNEESYESDVFEGDAYQQAGYLPKAMFILTCIVFITFLLLLLIWLFGETIF